MEDNNQQNQSSKKSIQTFEKGLSTDTDNLNQPQGTYRYAFCVTEETEDGDMGKKITENSNQVITFIPDGFIIIGNVHIDNNNIALFLHNVDKGISEIGVFNTNINSYSTYVNDEDTPNKYKLNFNSNYPIEAVYRLRRGCERTLYFTDNYNEIRSVNLDNLEIFKTNNWFDSRKFKLSKSVNYTPNVVDVQVLDYGGSLEPGAYSFYLQYFDENLNPTKYVELIKNIIIYNSSLKSNYVDIVGSANLSDNADNPDLGQYKYEKVNKSILLKLDQLDDIYPYYKIIIVEYTNSNGKISKIKKSTLNSTKTFEYLYTGAYEELGTRNELVLLGEESDLVYAKNLAIKDNRLIVSNTRGKEYKFEKLQKYASLINADCIIKKVKLNDINDKHNCKNPLVNTGYQFYMPGEVYSFTISYLTEDHIWTPEFHIPGKPSNVDFNHVYTNGLNIRPMSNINNEGNIRYIKNENCKNIDYWGIDSQGNYLEGNKVRFHRFPERKDIGVPLIDFYNTKNQTILNSYLKLKLDGEFKVYYECPKKDGTNEPIDNCNDILTKNQYLKIEVFTKDNSEPQIFQITILKNGNTPTENVFDVSGEISNIKLYSRFNEDEDYVELELNNNETQVQENGVKYIFDSVYDIESKSEDDLYGNGLGIVFSNINFPSEEEIGVKIIGYRISRHERTNNDKTILDTGVILPMIKHNDYISTSLLAPEYVRETNYLNQATILPQTPKPNSKNFSDISDVSFNLLTPLHKFKDETFDSFDTIEEIGSYNIHRREYDGFIEEDIQEGSSASGKEIKNDKDDDGFSLRHLTRFNIVKYNPNVNIDSYLKLKNDGVEIYNFDAINNSQTKDKKYYLNNIMADNKSLCMYFKNGINNNFYTNGDKESRLPYVVIKKDNKTFYNDFLIRPCYTTSSKVFSTEEKSCTIFGGDIYISPMRYSSHIYFSHKIAKREQKNGVWKIILGGLIVVASFLLPGSTPLALALGAGLFGAGVATLGIASYISAERFREIYEKKWEKYIEKTVHDVYTKSVFVNTNYLKKENNTWLYNTIHNRQATDYDDDSFLWMGDVISDLYFESEINLGLRVEARYVKNNFMKPQNGTWGSYSEQVAALATRNHDNEIYAGNPSFMSHFKDRLLVRNLNLDDNSEKYRERYSYTGVSLPQVYLQNPDYTTKDNIKTNFIYPVVSTDYCSKCITRFPHRVYASQQSFQEEKVDNFKVILHNNYTDIPGETGEINNMFILQDKLFLHTENALWGMKNNLQEKVTNELTTYIGTGSYFGLPPTKLVNDTSIACSGLQHKWASLLFKNTYVYISENERNIYLFNGQNTQSISDIGMSTFFYRYLDIKRQDELVKDNPFNKLSKGYILGYDYIKKILYITKKDFEPTNEYFNYLNDLVTFNGIEGFLYKDFNNIINRNKRNGWKYEGIKNNKLLFSKEKYYDKITTIEKRTSIFNEADYILFRYMFNEINGQDLDTRTKVIFPFESVKYGWGLTENAEGLNLSPYVKWGGDNTGYGVECFYINVKKIKEDFPNAINIIFECSAFWFSSRNNGDTFIRAEAYKGGELIHTGHNCGNGANDCYNFKIQNGELLGHYDFPKKNITLQTKERSTNGEKLGTFTFNIKNGELIWDDLSGGDIKPKEKIEIITNKNKQLKTLFKYEDYETIDLDKLIGKRNDWTISFSMKNKHWVSFHPYTPNKYLSTPHKFYSYINSNNGIYQHNIRGKYLEFYGKKYPLIFDYVSNPNILFTKVWNQISLRTFAEKYNSELNNFYEDRFTTFTLMILSNSRQCSGEIKLKVKDIETVNEDYLLNQVVDNSNHSLIEKREKDWFINDFRDITINYNEPIFNGDYLNKELNNDILNINKDWSEQESFRDKYLNIRFIFNKFDDTKLSLLCTINDQQISKF